MLETMSDFFTARTEMYDEHMLTEVEGCKEGYKKMASLVPMGTETLLDLGCGTGLELEEYYKHAVDYQKLDMLTKKLLIKLFCDK